MAYTSVSGPPDVDASHAWAPATGLAPPVINDWTSDPPGLPYFALEEITGWRSGPDADDNREPRTLLPGEIAYPGMLQGRTLVYEGTVAAATREALGLVVTGLLNGYADRSGLGTMTVTPFSSVGGVVWQYQARVLDLAFEALTYTDASVHRDLLPVIGAAGAWRRPCMLTLRMLDPYFYTPALGGRRRCELRHAGRPQHPRLRRATRSSPSPSRPTGRSSCTPPSSPAPGTTTPPSAARPTTAAGRPPTPSASTAPSAPSSPTPARSSTTRPGWRCSSTSGASRPPTSPSSTPT
jgi:hypothetical protein